MIHIVYTINIGAEKEWYLQKNENGATERLWI